MQISEQLIADVVSQVLQQIKNQEHFENEAPDVESSKKMTVTDVGVAKAGTNPKEVVIAIGPAFLKTMHRTSEKIPHEIVLRELIAGIEEEGCIPRVVRILKTSDCGFLGYYGAQLAGSGIAIGIQSKGTTVITQKDLAPLNNLELFSLGPLITVEHYRAIGRNAAKYAKGESPNPVQITYDSTCYANKQALATLLHNMETDQVVLNADAREIEVKFN